MSRHPEAHWQGVPPDALIWRDWGGDVVVFNQQTGSTHLLGRFAAELLQNLSRCTDGATIGILADGFSDDADLPTDAGLTEAVAGALSDFARLGLARRVER